MNSQTKPSMSSRTLAFALVFFGVTLGGGSASFGLTFEVASSSDLPDSNPGNGLCYASVGMFGVCTLRAAVEEANALPGPDTILVPAGTFTLGSTHGQLVLDDDVSISGAGSRSTAIETDGSHRMILIEEGVVASITDLAMRGATFSSHWGGAIQASSTSDLTIARVWFDNNDSRLGCGAVDSRGTLSVTDSTFSNNRASFFSDGGALCVVFGGQAVVTNTTFYGNFGWFGGAIYITGATSSLTLQSSTLVDNLDSSPSSADATLHLASGHLHLDKNIMRPDNCHYYDIDAVSSNGGNAVGPGNGCVLDLPSDITGLDWQDFALGSLGDYGGPVPTILPGTLSLVVDPGLSTATCPTFDARGEPRVDRCDVGAVERQLDDPESGPLFVDGFESGDTTAW